MCYSISVEPKLNYTLFLIQCVGRPDGPSDYLVPFFWSHSPHLVVDSLFHSVLLTHVKMFALCVRLKHYGAINIKTQHLMRLLII